MRNGVCTLLSLTMLWALPAWGGVIIAPPGDPQVADLLPSEPGGGGPPASHIGGLTFSFTSATGTSPGLSPCVIAGISDSVCDFVNVSGQAWETLTITVTPGHSLTACAPISVFYSACVPTQQGDSSTPSILSFSGTPGIGDAEAFSLAVVGWDPGTRFAVSANGAPPPSEASPEPGTWLLLLGGLVGLGLAGGARWRHFSQASGLRGLSN
jgi:hypothetical protein